MGDRWDLWEIGGTCGRYVGLVGYMGGVFPNGICVAI